MPDKRPLEGALHSIVKIEDHIFELRYGFYEERDRISNTPCLVLPDLATAPIFTQNGHRIVTAIQSVCEHYRHPADRVKEDCCYTCDHYTDPYAEISICQCLHQKKKQE